MLQPYTALNSTLNTKKAMSVNTLISQSDLQRILTKEKAITTKLKLHSYFSTTSGQFKNIRPTVEITSALLNNTCLIQTCKAFIITEFQRSAIKQRQLKSGCQLQYVFSFKIIKFVGTLAYWHSFFLLIHFNLVIFIFYLER